MMKKILGNGNRSLRFPNLTLEPFHSTSRILEPVVLEESSVDYLNSQRMVLIHSLVVVYEFHPVTPRSQEEGTSTMYCRRNGGGLLVLNNRDGLFTETRNGRTENVFLGFICPLLTVSSNSENDNRDSFHRGRPLVV